jgi:hypothetical protein
MQIDHLLEDTSSGFTLQSEAGIWASQSYSYAGFSKEFTSSTVPGQGDSGPLTTLYAFANNNAATANVVALVGDAVARTSGASVFGMNLIARNDTGNTDSVLRGFEVDVEPAAGTTMSSSGAGGFFNAFNLAMPVPVMQFGGLSGGTWANGILSSHIRGAHYAVQSGDPTTAVSFINTQYGTFSGGAIVLGTGAAQSIFSGGTIFGTNPLFYGDGSGNWILNFGSGGLLIKNASGTNQVTIDSAGRTTWVAPTSAGATLTLNTLSGSPAISASGGIQAIGTVPTVSSCGTPAVTGGSWAGQFTVGSTTCNPVFTFVTAAAHGWHCRADDETSAVTFRQAGHTTTTSTLTASGAAGASDVIVFSCFAY